MLFLILIAEVEGFSQHLNDDCLKVVETEHCHRILKDTESLTTNEVLENLKPVTTERLNVSLPNVAHSVSLQSIIDNNVDFKIEKTKTKITPVSVRERTKNVSLLFNRKTILKIIKKN